MEAAFRVAYALDEADRLVPRSTAQKGGRYRCPACQSPLSLHAGTRYARHFAHLPGPLCAPETAKHRTAKLLIAQAVYEGRTGRGKTPEIMRTCGPCGAAIGQQLPERVDGVATGHRLPDGLVADLALLAGGSVAAIVEVRASHAVEAQKAARMDGTPWIEVAADAILSDPLHWFPIASGGLRPFGLCALCRHEESLERERRNAQRETLQALAASIGVTLPGAPYRAVAHDCYRCRRPLIVFDWGDHYGKRKPPEPCPHTVQYRYSATMQTRYWANVCPHCSAIQGDHYVPLWFAESHDVVTLS